MQKVLFFVMVIGVSGLLSACSNTVDGVGKDLETAGQSIQRSTN